MTDCSSSNISQVLNNNLRSVEDNKRRAQVFEMYLETLSAIVATDVVDLWKTNGDVVIEFFGDFVECEFTMFHIIFRVRDALRIVRQYFWEGWCIHSTMWND
jgi:hypothetical protein